MGCSTLGDRWRPLRAWRRGGFLLAATVLAFGLASLSPAPAAAESVSRCRQMSRQIEHFLGVKAMARGRGDALWERGTDRHISHLLERQHRLCPRYLAAIKESKFRKAVEETKQFMLAAGKAAARYFTFGF